jgi:hypothetical protein
LRYSGRHPEFPDLLRVAKNEITQRHIDHHHADRKVGLSLTAALAKQQAFKRASEHLIGGGHVACWDGQVWLAKE